MSILDALKTFKQERESIDDVASLPQALIMQMAQKGQIPKTDVPMILARKAEIAQTQAQMNALRQQQTQGAAPTLMEKMIAANAQQEAPREMTDVGIASNPVPEMRMAGGGIIAFERGGDVPGMTDEERAEYIKNNAYLQRSKGLADFFAPLGRAENWDPVRSSYRAVNEYVMQPWQRFISESPADQATRFRASSNRAVQAANPTKEVPVTATASQRQETADKNDAMASVGQSSKIDYKKADEILKGSRKDNQRTTPAEAPTPNQPTTVTPKEKLFADYEKMLMDEREASKGAREEAKWSRLMEAGLNIMGGESPYAFSNIGKGAAAAARGYGEDVKGLRSEERDRVKQLASLGAKREELGLKERELGVMEKYRKDLTDLERQKIGILAQRNTDDKMAAGVNNIFAQLMKKYDAMLSDGSVTEQDLYRQAQEMYTSTTGKGMKGDSGNLPTANTFSWNQLGKK
jgi:hypothetical protein